MSKEGTALAQNCLQKAQIQLQALQVAASNLMLHVGSVVKQVDDMDCRITSLQSGLK